jgi:ADP-ribose pyrophosphatase YjhB (NUDIX family)
VSELVDIVDEAGAVVGVRERAELRDGEDRWRIVVLVVVSELRDRVPLVQRAWDKKHDPGRWAPPVAGTVASGESYSQAIERETLEELGLDVRADSLRVLYRICRERLRYLAGCSVVLFAGVSQRCWSLNHSWGNSGHQVRNSAGIWCRTERARLRTLCILQYHAR